MASRQSLCRVAHRLPSREDSHGHDTHSTFLARCSFVLLSSRGDASRGPCGFGRIGRSGLFLENFAEQLAAPSIAPSGAIATSRPAPPRGHSRSGPISNAAGLIAGPQLRISHDPPGRLLPSALELRLSATAAPAVAPRAPLAGRVRRRAIADRRRGLSEVEPAERRHRGASTVHARGGAGLPRRPARASRCPARRPLADIDRRRLRGLVLHADGLAAARRSATARDRLRLHGRAVPLQERPAPDAPARDRPC